MLGCAVAQVVAEGTAEPQRSEGWASPGACGLSQAWLAQHHIIEWRRRGLGPLEHGPGVKPLCLCEP